MRSCITKRPFSCLAHVRILSFHRLLMRPSQHMFETTAATGMAATHSAVMHIAKDEEADGDMGDDTAETAGIGDGDGEARDDTNPPTVGNTMK